MKVSRTGLYRVQHRDTDGSRRWETYQSSLTWNAALVYLGKTPKSYKCRFRVHPMPRIFTNRCKDVLWAFVSGAIDANFF